MTAIGGGNPALPEANRARWVKALAAAPDLNRHLARTTPYAARFAGLERAGSGEGD